MGPAVLLVQRILPPFNRVVGKIFGLGEDESRSVQDYSFDAIPVLRASWRDVRSLSVCTVAWPWELMGWVHGKHGIPCCLKIHEDSYASEGVWSKQWVLQSCVRKKTTQISEKTILWSIRSFEPLQVYEPHHNKILKYCIYDNTRALISGVFLLLSSSLLFTIMIMAAASQSDHMRRTWQICDLDTEWDRRITSSFFSVSKFTSVWTPGE